MTLADGQCQIGTLVIGDGTNYPFAAIRGLGKPDVRASDLAPAAADGEYLGVDYLGARIIEFDGLVVRGNGPADTWANLDALEAALPGGDTTATLRIKRYGRGQVMIDVRNRGFEYDDSLVRQSIIRVPLLLFKAADPTLVADPS